MFFKNIKIFFGYCFKTRWIFKPPKKNKYLVFVTHYVVISEVLNSTVSSGAIIVADKNYNILGSIETD